MVTQRVGFGDGERQTAKVARLRNSTRWKRMRAVHMREHPVCANCERQGRVVIGVVCDHIVPHRGEEKLFYDRENLQTLCRECDVEKSALERVGKVHLFGVEKSEQARPEQDPEYIRLSSVVGENS